MANNIIYDQFIESLTKRKKTFDALGMRIMGETDFEIANKVAEKIPSFILKETPTGELISQEEAFKRSYPYLKLINSDYTDKVIKETKDVEVQNVFPIMNTFTTYIQFSLDERTNKVDKNSGAVNHYKTPRAFDEISPLWLAHEHTHALKETNYEEYIDGQIFGDVIPMFLELLMTDHIDKKLLKIFITNRLFFLKNEHISTQKAKNILSDQKDLYTVFASSSMQYLNSFYYSLQLYEMYKSNDERVLQEVCDVLDHKKTTRIMLQELGLLYNYKEDELKKSVENLLIKRKTK